MAGHTWQDIQRLNHRTTYMARHTYEKILLIHGRTYMARHTKIKSSHDIHGKTHLRKNLVDSWQDIHGKTYKDQIIARHTWHDNYTDMT